MRGPWGGGRRKEGRHERAIPAPDQGQERAVDVLGAALPVVASLVAGLPLAAWIGNVGSGGDRR